VVLSNVVASSAEIHKKYGGVIPEIAAREQVKVIMPVIEEALIKALGEKWRGKLVEIEGIAVARGPGMMGSLLVGVETAKVLALAWKKKLLAVNHMVGHVMANWIVEGNSRVPELPAVGLVVSGGHTDLILMKSLTDWKWLGGTRDDAAGEAFDKTARLLGLSEYIGGPAIEKAGNLADEDLVGKNNKKFCLPRPMINEDNYEMSFSGLKTAVRRKVEIFRKNDGLGEEVINCLAREFNTAMSEVLIKKTMKAVREYQPRSILLAGGVAANKMLRERLRKEANKMNVSFFVPDFKYCTDNAAMIGAAAAMRPSYIEPEKMQADPSLGVI